MSDAAPVTRDSGRFTVVQALRGLAALWVVLFHVRAAGQIGQLEAQLPQWADQILTAGHLGVAIFFALSGFVIAHSIRQACITPSYLWRFMLRRSIRLDPPYWASIAFVVFLGAVSATVKGEALDLPRVPQTIAHLFYLQTLLGYPQINWVYWTLTYEIQFYLVLVFLIMLAQKAKVAVPLVAMVPFAFTVGIWLHYIPEIGGLFINLWHAFLAGALAYWAGTNRLALHLLAVVCGFSLALSPDSFTVLSLATALGLLLALRSGYIYRGLSWRGLQFLGAVSYSLYLIHNPVIGAVSFISSRLISLEAITLMLSIAASIGAAAVFWYLFERPSLAFAHRIRLTKPIKEPAASGAVRF